MADEEIKVDSMLVRLCIEAACASPECVERWRRQRRTLERLPSPLAEALLRRLLHRRLLYPSLLEIFKSSLEDVDLRGENSVDAEWMAYVGAFTYMRSLNLADCHRVTSSALWPIAGLTSLKEIDLSRCAKFTDAGVDHLLSIPHLEKLHISQTGVTVDGIKPLSSLENLTTLDLGGLPVSDSILDSLQALTRLGHLDLWGSRISNKGIMILKNFPKLTLLNLAWTNVTIFPNLKHLEHLNMSNCTIDSVLENNGVRSPLRKLILHGASFKIATEEVFAYLDSSSLTFLDVSNTPLNHFGFLHSMPALEHLDLSSAMAQDESIEHVAEIGANLRHLYLNYTKISSAGVAALVGNVPKLENLSLSHTSVDDMVIVYVGMLSQLQAIDLSNTNITGLAHQTDDGEEEVLSLLELQNLRHLKKIDLSGTQITDSTLAPLSSFQELSNLSLKSARLTDNCLIHLASVRNLVNLSIGDALLTNDALDLLDQPPKLRSLDLRGCWLLTSDALTLYCQRHAKIKVRHELLQTPILTGPATSVYGSPSRLTPQNLAPKQKGSKPSGSSSPFKKDVLDQRIKYSREQLLSLEHGSTALVTSACIDALVSESLIDSYSW